MRFGIGLAIGCLPQPPVSQGDSQVTGYPVFGLAADGT